MNPGRIIQARQESIDRDTIKDIRLYISHNTLICLDFGYSHVTNALNISYTEPHLPHLMKYNSPIADVLATKIRLDKQLLSKLHQMVHEKDFSPLQAICSYECNLNTSTERESKEKLTEEHHHI